MLPFRISDAQQAASNKRFPPLAVRQNLTASLGVRTGVRIDASEDPGIVLLASFVPAVLVDGGVRRVAACQKVSGHVSVDFNQLLPISWMASVMRTGDLAPSQSLAPYSKLSDAFQLSFSGELVISHEDGAWTLPKYDADLYSVNVGFGIGTGWAAWGYSVPCRPGQTIKSMDAGGYQVVRSGGGETIGDPVPDLESWTLPLGSQYLLAFNGKGAGILTKS